MIPIIIKTIADISLLKPQDMYIIVPVGLDYQNPLTFITTDMERLLIEEAIYTKFKTDTVIIKDDKSVSRSMPDISKMTEKQLVDLANSLGIEASVKDTKSNTILKIKQYYNAQ